MKNGLREKIIVALFGLAIVLNVAGIIALSVYEINLPDPHEHTYVSKIVAPTCTQAGYVLYTCECNESYKEEGAPPLGHDYAEEFTIDIQPDCTEKGSKSKHCSRCESTDEVTEIPANGHTYGDWETVTEAKCVDAGEETRKCAVCLTWDIRPITPLGHDYAEEFTVDIEPDCTEKGSKSKHCSRCESTDEVTEIPANGHTYGEWEIVTEAKCETDGVKLRTCSQCGGEDKEINEALGHNIEYLADEYYHEGTCTRCETFSRSKHAFDETVCETCSYEVYPTQGLVYELNEDGVSYSVKSIGTATDVTDLVIFSTYNGLPVTKISYYAFSNNKNLRSVCLYGIETISDSAFSNCSNIEKLILPDTLSVIDACGLNTNVLKQINLDSASPKFHCVNNNCLIETETKTLVLGCTQSVIPDDGSVTVIGRGAFAARSGLTEIVIPNTVTEIKYEAFWYCGFNEIVIPSSVKFIDYNAFIYCRNLTKLKLSEGLERIKSSAFSGCSALQEVEIPSSVVEINYGAFSGCTNLSRVYINDGVQKIDGTVFKNTAITELVIPKSVSSIAGTVVSGCENLISLTVDSENLTYHSAGNCIIETATKTLTVGCNVSVIPDDGSVTVIGDSAFSGRNFERIHMPDCITEIGSAAFAFCNNLTELPLTGNIKTMGVQVFKRCDGLIDVVIPYGITAIGGAAFAHCQNLERVSISDSVTIIGHGAFSLCVKLKSVNIPSSVTTIGLSAFYRCDSLESITIPGSVTEIEPFAFYLCTGLKKVVIEEGVQDISNAFMDCTSLEEIILPKSMTILDRYCFEGSTLLKTVRYAGTVNEWNVLYEYSRISLPEDCRIVCADGVILTDGTVLPIE